jgi:hypothetical protein
MLVGIIAQLYFTFLMSSNLNDDGTKDFSKYNILNLSPRFLNENGKKYYRHSGKFGYPLILIGFIIGVILSIIF